MRTTVLLPELLIGGCAVASAVVARARSRQIHRLAGLVVLALVVVAVGLELWQGATVGTLFQGGFAQDRFALFIKTALLLATLVVLAIAEGGGEGRVDAFSRTTLLLTCFGGMVVASATDLVSLWAGLALAVLAAAAGAAIVEGRAEPTRTLSQLEVGGIGLAVVGFGVAVLASIGGGGDLHRLSSAVMGQKPAIGLVLAFILPILGVVAIAVQMVRTILTDEPDPLRSGSAVLGAGVAGVVVFRLAAVFAGEGSEWAVPLAVLVAAGLVAAGLVGAAAPGPRVQVGVLILGQLALCVGGAVAGDLTGLTEGLFLLGAWLLVAPAAAALLDLTHGSSWPGLAGMGSIGGFPAACAAGLLASALSLAAVPPLAGSVGGFAVLIELARSGYGWVVTLGLLAWVLLLVGSLRLARALYWESAADDGHGGRRSRGDTTTFRRFAAGVSGPQRFVAWLGVVVLVLIPAAYLGLGNPIHSLAFQAAEALGLR